jgi:UDPglucose--hexose-1-phosphate uridylyltransferase
MLPLTDSSHRRLNILTGEWVLVSPHRAERPWRGLIEESQMRPEPEYDPSCYLCPGNPRAKGERNPFYSSTFVFENDYPALSPEPVGPELVGPESIEKQTVGNSLLAAEPERGICRVGCFSPRHDLTLSGMSLPEIAPVIAMWREQFADLGKRDFVNYVAIFENHGAMMGASNPHPHCQIWGTSTLPNEPGKEQRSLRSYLELHHSCLLCEYMKSEESLGERVVFENEGFIVLVPFWAVWPFETMILPRRHRADLPALSPDETKDLAVTLKKLTACYDRLFNTPFPYSMGFHQKPTDGKTHPEWHFHAHFFPPLLRSASIRKFMVGFELLGTPQRDITPESAAQRLRDVFLANC